MQALRFEPSRALVSTRALAIFAAFCVSLADCPQRRNDRPREGGRPHQPRLFPHARRLPCDGGRRRPRGLLRRAVQANRRSP